MQNDDLRTTCPTLRNLVAAKSLLRSCAAPVPTQIESRRSRPESAGVTQGQHDQRPLPHNGFRLSIGSGGGVAPGEAPGEGLEPPTFGLTDRHHQTRYPAHIPCGTRLSPVSSTARSELLPSLCPRRRGSREYHGGVHVYERTKRPLLSLGGHCRYRHAEPFGHEVALATGPQGVASAYDTGSRRLAGAPIRA